MRKIMGNVYKVTVFSRHSGRERTLGICAPNMAKAKWKAQHEVGKVLKIKRASKYSLMPVEYSID